MPFRCAECRTGDLLVAEANQVSTISGSQLNQGLASALLNRFGPRPTLRVTVFTSVAPGGIAVDRCTGKIYTSDPQLGTILEFDRTTAELRTIAEGISTPTQLLSLYRSGLSCRFAFQLLVVGQGAGRIELVIPRTSTVQRWVDAPGARDVAFLPVESDTAPEAGVLVAEAPDDTGRVTQVETPQLYRSDPINPSVRDEGDVEPEPEPEPELPGMVEFTFTGEQQFVIACTDQASSRLEVGASLATRFEGNSERNGGLLINGSFTDNEEELCQGTGVFSEVECFGPEVLQGSFRVDISPSESPGSPTNLAGSWRLTTLDDNANEDNTFLFDVTQVSNELSGSFLVGNAEECLNCYFLPDDSTVTCPEPGQCSVNSPEIGTCTLTCDPATPNCGLEVQVSGTVR